MIRITEWFGQAHAALIGIPFYIPSSVFAARFGQEDTGLQVNMQDGSGYAFALVWAQVAGRIGEGAGWELVFLILAGIAGCGSLMFHMFFSNAKDLMYTEIYTAQNNPDGAETNVEFTELDQHSALGDKLDKQATKHSILQLPICAS